MMMAMIEASQSVVLERAVCARITTRLDVRFGFDRLRAVDLDPFRQESLEALRPASGALARPPVIDVSPTGSLALGVADVADALRLIVLSHALHRFSPSKW